MNEFFLSVRKVLWLDFREGHMTDFKAYEDLVVRAKEGLSEEISR